MPTIRELLEMKQEDLDKQSSPRYEKLMDMLGRPGASFRRGVSELQEAKNPFPAMLQQLGQPSNTAPTGADLAEKVTTNPLAGAALATILDVADPSQLIPATKAPMVMGGVKNLGKVVRGANIDKTMDVLKSNKSKMFQFPGLEVEARNAAEAKQAYDLLSGKGDKQLDFAKAFENLKKLVKEKE